MSSDAGKIPPELMCRAQALIGLSGLDARNNVQHRAIWDAFNSNRLQDRYCKKTINRSSLIYSYI